MPSKKTDPAIEPVDGAMLNDEGGGSIAQALVEGITSMLQHPEDIGPDEDIPAGEGGNVTDDVVPADESEAGSGDAPASPPKKKAAAKKTTAKKKAKADDSPAEPIPAIEEQPAVDVVSEDGPAAFEDTANAAEEQISLTEPAPVLVEEPLADTAGQEGDVHITIYEKPVRKRPPRPMDAAPAAPPAPTAPPRRKAHRKKAPDLNVLKIDAYSDIETPEDKEDLIWHEIHNAYRTRRILTGLLGGVEKAENGVCRAVIEYKGFRIMITMDEMMLQLPGDTSRHTEPPGVRKERRLNTMIYSQVDFVVRGIDSKTRSVIASRKDAMLKKRQIFYMNADHQGMPRIHEGRVVQARVIGVFEKVIRVEVFGVETTIIARDLSWEWIGDARQHYSVGDTILVRINQVSADSVEAISIAADARSVKSQDGSESLKKCRIQGKYAGTVTDVRRGTVLVRLSIGVNAIAHSCFDSRVPGKKDDVSFVVTHIEEEKGVAMGIITRVIRQNL